MFPTENNTDIGRIWDPFTAKYTKEHIQKIVEERIRRKKAIGALDLIVSLAISL